MQKLTIAIDGFSSCGKSTLARALAQKLNYRYIDTGAMYRAVTVFAMRERLVASVDHIQVKELLERLPEIEIGFVHNPETHHSDVTLNEMNIEKEIRTMAVSEVVPKISAIKEVREKMVHLQRQMGKRKGVVLDGRDIGTNVFPHAELKIFMTADEEVRAKRRLDEYSSKGQYFTLEEVKHHLKKRDEEDINRKENPLIRADDAVELDNSDLTREEQLEFVLKLIHDFHLLAQGNAQH